jgi:hypothetical protein
MSRLHSRTIVCLTLGLVTELVVGQHRQNNVPSGDGKVLSTQGRLSVFGEGLDYRIGNGQEVAIGGVEEVGYPPAVAVEGQAQRPDDPVAVRLDHDVLDVMLHRSQHIGAPTRAVEPCRLAEAEYRSR